ncbi:carboxylesterase family protein [Streptomyces sp. NPDC000594]|uniref:carboxylesterase/lipase family protein n=1 Tax=Streptomyces sp. NPDC000594 TaxID=3154261 RepID=UPI00332E037F
MTTSRQAAAEGAGPVVRTVSGVVRGRTEEGLAVFRGIPFARPPVGEARFAAPRPPEPWDGVRDAFFFGPPPVQTPLQMVAPATTETDTPGGDDWLTVNIWSPEPAAGARLPVMVWIYGGGYTMGMSGEYDGARLAREGGVVLVTLNYRVGFEGFGHIEGAPANRGLLDQMSALEWVQGNIAAFGGDPGRVTVFGESAGAGSIAALLAVPRARGLFGRAIAQSVPGTFLSPELAADIASTIASSLGAKATVTDLAAVSPAALAQAAGAHAAASRQYAGRWGAIADTSMLICPVVDGDVLPAAPWQDVAAGSARQVDLIVGHTRDEFRLALVLGGLLGTVTGDQAHAALSSLAPAPDGERAYRQAFPEASDEHLYELVHSDWLFRMPTVHLAEAQAAAGGQVHAYELTWPAPAFDGLPGACHGLDVPLTFGDFTTEASATLIGGDARHDAEALSARFRRAWTSFATDGDPGWPPYRPPGRLTQLIDTETRTAPYANEESRRIWANHTFTAMPLLHP